MTMNQLDLPLNLQDKIYEINFLENNMIKITSYFPLNNSDQKELLVLIPDKQLKFHSIFIDNISEDDWNKTKDQIKKKFNDELFDID